MNAHLTYFVTTARRVLGIRMKKRPLVMVGSCEYVECVADSRKWVVLQLGEEVLGPEKILWWTGLIWLMIGTSGGLL
jgi:hypothetical protein